MQKHVFLMILIACSAGVSSAQPNGPVGHHGPNLMHQLEELGVDDQTKTRIKSLMLKTRKSVVPIKSKLEMAKIELHELLDSSEVDETKVMSALDRVAALTLQIKKLRMKAMLGVQKLLTPDQRTQMKKRMKKQHKRGMHHRRHQQ